MIKHCRRIIVSLATLTLLLMIFLRAHGTVVASVAGGAGSMSLSPANATIPVGTSQNVNILFNTAGVAVSGVQVVLKFTVANPADLQATVQTNSALADSGWTFPVKNVTTSGSQVTIEIMGLNTSTTGYTNTANTTLATISFQALGTFTNKAVTFDAALTKMLRKDNADDMLGSPSNGAYSTSGVANTPTNTPTGTVTHTPTRTPTATPPGGIGGSGNENTAPTCVALTSDVTTGNGTPTTVTFTCSGVDPGGDIRAAEFKFGDGVTQGVDKNVGSPGSITVTHTYNTIGTLGASCRVKDNDNVYSTLTDSCRRTITIRPRTAGASTPTPTRVAAGTATATTTPTPSVTGYVYQTATPFPTGDEVAAPTPEPIFPEDETATEGNRFWWIVGGALALLVAFLLLRRNKPPMPPPASPYAPQQPKVYEETPVHQPPQSGEPPTAQS